ncbi:hypothetical protein NCAST_32_10280 [Nocardia asteroides NBRC 15531]|uniref:Uncharacterized protein n=1 Tax=Nocardia asteroides NBRC 15531 TaxID=1110697 RepID=U5EJG7_NOCAS|nr:hypothetical protein NCAST_32_10280 [Nocardia asteroides NBRC 15531]
MTTDNARLALHSAPPPGIEPAWCRFLGGGRIHPEAQQHQEGTVTSSERTRPLPERTPKPLQPQPLEVAPPEIIRRLLVALEVWEPQWRAS